MSKELRNRIEKALIKGGDLYSFADIVDAVKSGKMQSFAINQSWAVTQIIEFPRKRALDIVFAVGNLADMIVIEDQITEFAKEHGCQLLIADGRLGWSKVKKTGWKVSSATYIKDLNDVLEAA